MWQLFRVDWQGHTGFMLFDRRDCWTAFERMWSYIAHAETTKQLVGTWTVKPKTTQRWLNERHPGSTYLIRSNLPLGPG